jgi:hypothetical protein
MTSEQRLDLLERMAENLASPVFGEGRRRREQQQKIKILLDGQKRNAELFAKLEESLKPKDDVERQD